MYESGADNGWTVVSGDTGADAPTFVVLPFAAAVCGSEAGSLLFIYPVFQELWLDDLPFA